MAPPINAQPIKGVPPSLEFRAVGELQVDPVYQRATDNEASIKLIRRIAQHWDWGLCQPLTVARRADGKLYVVDGQHRWEGALLRGDIPHLPCVIINYADEASEAKAFVDLNQRRKPLNALDLYKAALAAGDPAAKEVAAALTAAGLRLAPHSNYTAWKPGMVSNIGGIQRTLATHGMQVLVEALAVLAEAFDGQVLRYAGTVFPGIVAGVMMKGYSRDRLVETLGLRSQVEWANAGIVAGVEEGRRDKGMARVVREAVLALFPPAPEPRAPKLPEVEILLAENEFGWCSQCDRRVHYAKVKACSDKFCALKQQPTGVAA